MSIISLSKVAGAHYRLEGSIPLRCGGANAFISLDRDASRRANIWVTDLRRRSPVKSPGSPITTSTCPIGPANQLPAGRKLYVLDLRSENLRPVEVTVPADLECPARSASGPLSEPERLCALCEWPNAFFSARGTCLPLDSMGRCQPDSDANSAEDHPCRLADAHTLAFITDAGGEQQVATMPIGADPCTTHSLQIWITLRTALVIGRQVLAVRTAITPLARRAAGDRCERIALDPAPRSATPGFRRRALARLQHERPSAARNSSARSRHRPRFDRQRDQWRMTTIPLFGRRTVLIFLSQRHELPMSQTATARHDRDAESRMRSMRLRSPPECACRSAHPAKTRRLPTMGVDLSD